MENQNKNNLVSAQNQNSSVIKVDIGVLFSGDSYGLFVFQKTERLVKAIYLLTSIMSDKEPMRERVRTLANSMLESALSMSDRIWGEDSCHKNLLGFISETSILFDISESAKMMSKMNHKIITSELQKLADFLVTSLANYSSAKIAFEPNLFDGDYNYIPDQNFQSKTIIQSSSASPSNEFLEDINYPKRQSEMSVKNSAESQIEKKSVEKIAEPVKNIKDKNNRQDIILSMLSSGVKLTIKDFAKNIKGCSDKTIQRELSSLVSKGVLKKEGERRWSKYFLIK